MPLKFWKSEAAIPTAKDKDGSDASSEPEPIAIIPLRDQVVVEAKAETKIRLAILATALVDALGGPPEFNPRFSFPLVTTLLPNDNFGLPSGVWTDDTSMTLCLARSLARFGFDEGRQLEAYAKWYQQGELSAVGRCFDIGNTIKRALIIYAQTPNSPSKALQRIHKDLSGANNAGNGSLMRVLPVGLAFWHDLDAARAYARRSSQTTHPTALCLEACEMWTAAITQIMQEAAKADQGMGTYSKLDLLQYISEYPYLAEKLRQALTVPPDAPPFSNTNAAGREEYYQKFHPILRLVKKSRNRNTDQQAILQGSFPFSIPPTRDLPSSGYVLHTLVAALYCFFATDSFERGAILAVNLGDDADTVGAVYAGLAGCWYAAEEGGTSQLFWSAKVTEWKQGLVKRELVEQVAEELVEFSKKHIANSHSNQ